jgi:Tol biopolymer transport system component
MLQDGHVVLRDLQTGNSRDISADGGYAETLPVFTPDGKRILYRWRRAGGTDRSLRIVDIDGRNDRSIRWTLAPGETSFLIPFVAAISRDGSKAAVSACDGSTCVIALVELADGRTTIVKRLPLGVTAGNFSPDGHYLTYSRPVERLSADREVHVMSVDGARDTIVLGPNGGHTRPFFAPDGNRVVVASDRAAGRWDLWAIPVAGNRSTGTAQLLKSDLGPSISLGFGDDGTFYYRESIPQDDAYLVDLDPATHKAIGTPAPASGQFVHSTAGPIWSPDSRSLAYVARVGEQPHTVSIVVRTLDTGHEHELPVPYDRPDLARYFRWFPDGRALLLVDATQKGRTFRRLDLESGEITPLFDTPTRGKYRMTIDPDGSGMYYATATQLAGPQHMRWIRRDLKTGAERTVFETAAESINASPDAVHLTYIDRATGPLHLVSLPDGRDRVVWAPPDVNLDTGGMSWAPGNSGFYLGIVPVHGEDDPTQKPVEVWFVSWDGQTAEPVGVSMPSMNTLWVRPDGRQLGFSGSSTRVEVWGLAGLFSRNAR